MPIFKEQAKDVPRPHPESRMFFNMIILHIHLPAINGRKPIILIIINNLFHEIEQYMSV
jgi:hypothetical protein